MIRKKYISLCAVVVAGLTTVAVYADLKNDKIVQTPMRENSSIKTMSESKGERKMDMDKKTFDTIVVRSPFVDEFEQYDKLAEECAKAGVTHLTFTEAERSFWELDNPDDPYLQWSIVHTGMFKIFPPELLKNWVPHDYAKKAQATIARKAQILKKHGLKGAVFIYDPMWWPEEIFLKYPHLRGPRVDQPRRCLQPRFSPCIDRPEVLDMYKQAFLKLNELADGVLDIVIIRTNDSAAGICWADGLYNSPNGPEFCRGISFAERMKKLCAGIREGAGGDVKIYTGGNVSSREQKDLLSMDDKSGYYVHIGAGNGNDRTLNGRQISFPLYPLKGLANPVEIIEHMSDAYSRGQKKIVFFTYPTMYGSNWNGDPLLLRAIGHMIKNPSYSFLHKIDILKTLAAEQYGEENADDIIAAWWNISRAGETMKKYDRGMNMIFLGVLGQRWLTRPFVVLPETLTEDEKSYYIKHVFQVNKSHKNLDLLNCQGSRSIDAIEHLKHFNRDIDFVCGEYGKAKQALLRAYGRSGDSRLKDDADSIDILLCLIKNIRNCTNFQVYLEALKNKLAKYANLPDIYSMVEVERAELYGIMRSEIENCECLAKLLEDTDKKLIFYSKTSDEETPFMLGPDVIADLRKKTKIMFNHWLDMNQLVSPPNR